MRKFRTGNVYKLYTGSLVIISNVRIIENKEYIDYIFFDYSNSSGGSYIETKEEKSMCWECDTNNSEYPNYECENCKGTGYYMRERIGMDKAIYLADNVKEYIMKRLLVNFDF
jgi:hypothetical protein